MLFQGKQFLPYAAGDKIYGGGRDAPNVGPVDGITGYRERDMKYHARRVAMQRRLAALKNQNLASPDVGRTI
jgi:hypothetical protein